MKLKNTMYLYCDRWTNDGSFLTATMLKRTLLTFVMTVLPITIFAYDTTIFYGPLFFDIDYTNKTASVRRNTSPWFMPQYSGDIVIPSEVDDGITPDKFTVIEIGDEAFLQCSELTSVTIPNSVTSIGRNAFSFDSKLTSVTMSDSLESIGVAAFSWCAALTSIIIPNNVKHIGGAAFRGTGLTSVTIPEIGRAHV